MIIVILFSFFLTRVLLEIPETASNHVVPFLQGFVERADLSEQYKSKIRQLPPFFVDSPSANDLPAPLPSPAAPMVQEQDQNIPNRRWKLLEGFSECVSLSAYGASKLKKGRLAYQREFGTGRLQPLVNTISLPPPPASTPMPTPIGTPTPQTPLFASTPGTPTVSTPTLGVLSTSSLLSQLMEPADTVEIVGQSGGGGQPSYYPTLANPGYSQPLAAPAPVSKGTKRKASADSTAGKKAKPKTGQ